MVYKKEKFTYIYYITEFIKKILPITIGSLSPMLIQAADNIMVGHLSEKIRAASALTNSICSVPLFFLAGISAVLMPLVAGDVLVSGYKKATNSLQYMMVIAIGFGALSSLLLLLGCPLVCCLGQDKEVTEFACSGYFQMISISIFVTSIYQPMRRYLMGLGWQSLVMWLQISSSIINIILNYILINGHFAFPALGLFGSGLATLICKLITMSIYIIITYYLSNNRYKGSLIFKHWNKQRFFKILKVGIPAGFSLSIRIIYLLIIKIMIGVVSGLHLSATSIIFTLINIFLVFAISISNVASVFIAEAGMSNKKRIIKITGVGYMLTIIIAITMASIIYLFSNWILENIFSPNLEVRSIVYSLINMSVLMYIFDAFVIIGMGLLWGLKDTLFPSAATFFIYFLIGLPAAFIFTFILDLGIKGIFIGMLIGYSTLSLVINLRMSYLVNKYCKN